MDIMNMTSVPSQVFYCCWIIVACNLAIPHKSKRSVRRSRWITGTSSVTGRVRILYCQDRGSAKAWRFTQYVRHLSTPHNLCEAQQVIAGKMVYNWEGKRDTCYNMYITENKGLEEIQAFYREQGFNPRSVLYSRPYRPSIQDRPATSYYYIFRPSLPTSY